MADILDFTAAARRANRGWQRVHLDQFEGVFRVFLTRMPAVAGDAALLEPAAEFPTWRDAIEHAVQVGREHGGLPLLDMAVLRHGDAAVLNPPADRVIMREGRNGFDVLVSSEQGEWNAAFFSDPDAASAREQARGLAIRLRLPFTDRTDRQDHTAILADVAQRLSGRDVRMLDEIWLVQVGGSVSVDACFRNDPGGPFSICSDETFAALGRYSGVDEARRAAFAIADHYAVPVVDHTIPEAVA